MHDAAEQMLCLRVRQISEAEGIEGCDRPGTHGENIPVDAPDACGCALKGFDGGRMVVRFDLEHHAETIADIHQTRVFITGLDEQFFAIAGESLQPSNRILVAAVFAPHHGIGSQFRKIGGSTQDQSYLLEFICGQAQLLGGLHGRLHVHC